MLSGILTFLTSETSIFVILVEFDLLRLRDFSSFLLGFSGYFNIKPTTMCFSTSEIRKAMDFQKI